MKIQVKAEDNKSKIEYKETNKLAIGENTIVIKVTAENQETKTYKIIVTRKEKGQELDDNNSLKSIEIDGYTIDFNKDTESYTLKIKEEDKLNIKATAESEKALATIIGNEDLKNGSKIRISVTSEKGTVKEYVINIEKEEKTEPQSTKKEESNTMLYVGVGVFAVGLISVLGAFAKKKNNKEV